MRRFFKDERGIGTVEIVVIIAILIAVALIFRHAIMDFIEYMIDSIFGDDVKDGIKITLEGSNVKKYF